MFCLDTLFEKDPKERILSETVAYSLQKLEAFNRNTDKIMEIVNSEYNPKMFYEETILLLGVDGNKENWQTLRRLELSKNRLMRLLEVSRDNQGSLKY